MEILDILAIVSQIVTLVGILFIVYNSFRNPQIKNDKKDALLAQQVQWTIEGNERRFNEMHTEIKEAFELTQNHSNEALAGVKELTTVVNAMGKEITKMTTIIDERIPKKEC
jgi:hypothetical protein